ncbi:MAG: DUF3574 domain-containing protein [Hyphomicrobiaceae bacterium]
MPRPTRHSLLLIIAIALGAGTGAWVATSRWFVGEAGSATCGQAHTRLRRIELVFGLSRKDQVDVSDAAWSLFLAREVTPRFPDGLTVLSASGQWRNKAGDIVREPSRLLLIWAQPSADLDDRIEAIRSAWKSAHGQESVLRADGASCVSF